MGRRRYIKGPISVLSTYLSSNSKMVSATLQPAQLSHLAQNLVQIAIDCLELDPSEISLRSLDAFIENYTEMFGVHIVFEK